MNEPSIVVGFVYLGMIMAGLVLPAPLLAYAARRSERTLWLTTIGITLVLILVVGRHFAGRPEMNAGDQTLYRNLIILAIAATAVSAWAVNRKRRSNPTASFLSLLITAVSMQIAAAAVFAIMPGSC